MTLLITVFAAVLVTVVWYLTAERIDLKLPVLMAMFWGASLMWLVDAVVEYFEVGVEYFTPAIEDMINDGFLGGCVVALALVVWLILLLIKDPRGLKDKLIKKNGENR